MKVKIFEEYNEKIQQTSKKEILEIREKRENALFEEIMPKNFTEPKRDLKPQILGITLSVIKREGNEIIELKRPREKS